VRCNLTKFLFYLNLIEQKMDSLAIHFVILATSKLHL
jgi:hypothetical protein